MSLFGTDSDLTIYGGEFKEVKREFLSPEDIARLEGVSVVDSEFGPTVKFLLSRGRYTFIDLSKKSKLCVGDQPDPKTLQIVYLERDGKTIKRVEETL